MKGEGRDGRGGYEKKGTGRIRAEGREVEEGMGKGRYEGSGKGGEGMDETMRV